MGGWVMCQHTPTGRAVMVPRTVAMRPWWDGPRDHKIMCDGGQGRPEWFVRGDLIELEG